MKRVPFSQIVKNFPVDIRKEYERLFQLFYMEKFNGSSCIMTLYDVCACHFAKIPIRGTCLTLEDYCETFNFRFSDNPPDFDIDYLVLFCEFTVNILHFCLAYIDKYNERNTIDRILFYNQQVQKVIDMIGYMPNTNNKSAIIDYVAKDPSAISVAEIVEPKVSYKVIEYGHHSMKGDIERKKSALLMLGEMLEPHRKKLHSINSELESSVFFLLNNLNLRHNNVDKQGKNYIQFVASLDKEDMESYYDELYQMILLAFLELNNLDRKKIIDELKEKCKVVNH